MVWDVIYLRMMCFSFQEAQQAEWARREAEIERQGWSAREEKAAKKLTKEQGSSSKVYHL